MLASEKKSLDELWHLFLKGDDDSFSQIYQQTVNSLFLYGLKFTTDRDLVQDCLQEVFIEIHGKRKKGGNKIQNLKPYLFVAVRNGIVKRIVKESKLRSFDNDESYDLHEFLVEYSEEYKQIENEKESEVKEQLKNAVSSLPPKQKEIIYLKFEEELEYTEIAVIMDISVESARKSMHRAILSLRTLSKHNDAFNNF